MGLIIKGAYYYDRESDTILIPHFTGEYTAVDCTRYITLEDMKDRYDDNFIEENKDNFVEYNGQKYYYAEYRPYYINNWELLSDLSELQHNEMDFDF